VLALLEAKECCQLDSNLVRAESHICSGISSSEIRTTEKVRTQFYLWFK